MSSATLEQPVTRRKPVNLSLSEDLVARAKGHTRNLSGTVEVLLTHYVRDAEARKRESDARLDAVIDALNAIHDEHGFLSDDFCDYR